MGWKEQLRPASFRGVPFEVDSSNTSVGRKTAVHEIIDRAPDYVEDLGKGTRRYNLTAFVVEPNYKFKRDRLIKALEKPGDGQLTHPYYGNQTVKVVGMADIGESSREGGFASIRISFSLSKPPQFPTQLLSTFSDLVDQVNGTLEAINVGFQSAFDLIAAPQYVVDSVVGTLGSGIDFIEQTKNQVSNAFDFQDDINFLRANLGSLIFDPEEMANKFIDLMRPRANLTSDESRTSTLENLKIENFASTNVDQDPNELASVLFLQQAGIVAASESVTNINFENTTDAENFKQAVLAGIDNIITLSDIVDYDDFYNLRSAVILRIDDKSIGLPEIVKQINNITLPSLFIAFDFYENLNRTQEIETLNNVRHPGFMPGGVELDLISRV